MKSARSVIVFVLAGMVTLPQSSPAKPADIIVCSGSNQNCYYAPANIKLPATCFKGATKLLRAGPPVFGQDDRGQKHRSRCRRRIERRGEAITISAARAPAVPHP